MRFSVFTASTPDWSPEEAVRHLAAQGWDGVEWRVTDQAPATPPGFWAGNRATWPLAGLEGSVDSIREITRGAGLDFSGIGAYVSSDDHATVDRLLAVTRDLGAAQVRVGTPLLTRAPYPENFRQARSDYEVISKSAERMGVKVLIELHHTLITASASSALRLVDGLDPRNIGVIHDVGNTVFEGHEDYDAAFQLLGPYLAHVHVKNAAWRPRPIAEADGSVLWDASWSPLWNGVANLPEYFRALVRHGYDDWVTVEDFSTELALEERTRSNLAYLKRIEAAAHSAQAATT